MTQDLPPITQDSVRKAARIETGLPEAIEQQAIEIAARAQSMSGFEAALITMGSSETNRTNIDPWEADGRNETRQMVAVEDVRRYLLSQGVSLRADTDDTPHTDSDWRVMTLAQAGIDVANGRGGR